MNMDVNTANRKYANSINGFTLVELMAVVAIIGTMLLLSSANNQPIFDQGREAEAKAFLLQISSRQVRFWQQHSTYAESLAELNVFTPKGLKPYYKFELTKWRSSQPGYLAKAIPIDDKPLNRVLWVNHLGGHSSNWRF
jgi:prepilin-type N-terminal cleavage/methylation domain-containing protein